MSGEYSTTETEKPQELCLNEPVACLLNNQKKHGILRFLGETQFCDGVWYGIELNEPCGKNDGAVANVRYFQCNDRYGIFVNSKHVLPVENESVTKKAKRRVLPSVVDASAVLPASDLALDDLESRPRSKSDNAVNSNERTNHINTFSDSPFRCDFRGKSSSLPKLNNDTFICESPIIGGENNALFHPKHSSSPLALSQDKLHEAEAEVANEQSSPVSQVLDDKKSKEPPAHHHIQLSPHLEVKQSIKLNSISRMPAPLSTVKRVEGDLNKTFLVRKQASRLQKKIEAGNLKNYSTKPAKSTNDNCIKKNERSDKTGIITKSINETRNCTNAASVDESNSEVNRVRSRSSSKSSLHSSAESLSSVGSNKAEARRLKSTSSLKNPAKKPTRTTDAASKSKLLKISAESKIKPRSGTKEDLKTTQKSSTPPPGMNKVPQTDSSLKTKSRTKSTSTVSGGFKSVFDTPLSKRPPVAKSKSKSVSSEEAAVLTKSTPISTSKFSTPRFGSSVTSSNTAPRPRLTSSTRPTPLAERKSKLLSSTAMSGRKLGAQSTNASQNKVETRSSAKQGKDEDSKVEKRLVKQEENKSSVARSRLLSTPAANSVRNPGVKSSGIKSSLPRTQLRSSTSALASREPRKFSETLGEPSVLQKKSASQESIKRKAAVNEKKPSSSSSEVAPATCLNSALTPDILKQTPEVARQSVAVQVDDENAKNECHRLNELYKDEQRKVQTLVAMLTRRNRDFEATMVALQHYSQKTDFAIGRALHLRMCLSATNNQVLSARKIIEKEANQRVRLEDEMLSMKSDSVVELALLGAEFERKQEVLQNKLMEEHKKSLEKARKRSLKVMEEVKRSCDLKLKRVEETYVQDISQLNDNHKVVVNELETQHAKVIEELIEEREAEIETIKADYEEQTEELQSRISETNVKCNALGEKLRAEQEQSKKDIQSRIQDAIAEYKTLPAELESTKFVLEMKNSEIKKLRQNIAQYQRKIDDLQQAKSRAALLEREKESLHFVVENQAKSGRKLSLERDKLRLSLDRELAASKRLSFENEELAWRLNTFQNSPTSPSFDKLSWRTQSGFVSPSGFASPDSAVYSQRIEESDMESQINETKEASS